MVNGTKRPSSQRRLRSTVASSSSEDNSPASKRSTSTRLMASAPSATIEERTKERAKPPQNPDDMWAILVDIQSKVGQILAENATLRNEVEELKNAQQENNQQIDTLTSKMAQVTSQLNAMEKKTNEQQAYIEQLEENLEDLVLEKDALEQYTRKYNVEIHGVPERSDENLLELIPSIANKLGSSITSDSIDIVHRVYTKSTGPKPIILRFKSYREKENFYQSRFNLRDADLSGILPTENNAIPAIYINENLTQIRRQLFGKVWKLKKARKFHRVWTIDGKIFLRKSVGGRAIFVEDDSVLDEL